MRGIYTYKITLSNTTSTATPPNLQVRLNINFSAIRGLSIDLGNIRFTADQAGNNLLYAWLESAPQGTFTQSSSISSYTSSNVWVNLGNNIIPANGSLAIYMQVLTYTEFDGVYWGANPLWTSTYGQYDNGVNVFPYYQRWGALSSLPSNWVEVSGTVVTFASTYIEIAPAPSTSGWYGIYLNPIPSSLSSTTTVWEFYGNMYDGVFAGSYVGTSREATGNFAGYSFSEGGGPTNLIYLGNDNNQFDSSTGYDDTNTNKIYSMQVSSGTSVSMFINNTLIYSTTTATSESPTYFNFAVSNNGGSAPSSPQYIYWLRTRIYPPNGTDPVLTSISLLLGNYTSASIPVPDWKILKGKPYVTVSAKGISNGLSNILNDGADFGPDTPGTQTYGVKEAYQYAIANGIFHIKLNTGTYLLGEQIEITTPVWFEGSGGQPTMNEVVDGVYDAYNISTTNQVTALKINTNILNAPIPFIFYSTVYMAGMKMTNLVIDCNGLGGAISFVSPTSAPNNSHFDFTHTVIINTVSAVPLLCDFTGYGDLDIINLSLDNQNNGTPLGACIKVAGPNCTVRLINVLAYSYGATPGDIIIADGTSGGNSVVLMYGGLQQHIYVGTSCIYLSLVNAGNPTIVLNGSSNATGELMISVQGSLGAPLFDLTNVTTSSPLQVARVSIHDSSVATLFTNVASGVVLSNVFGKISARNCVATSSSVVPGITLPQFGSSGYYELNMENVLNVTPTLTANPPVSGTVYQNKNPYDIRIYLPAYATTSGTAGTVAIALGSSSTPSTIGTKFINGSTSSSATEIIELVVPVGWYYEFTATGVTFGTATVIVA